MQTSALRVYAHVLSDSGDGYDSQVRNEAATYADDWVKLEPGDTGLIFADLNDRTSRLAQTLRSGYACLSTSLTESAEGLLGSAATYDRTEQANNEQIDRVFPDVDPESLGDTDPRGARSDPEPAAQLKAPGTDGGIPDLANYIIQPTVLASPTGAILKILALAGLDPIGWLTDRLAGSPDSLGRVMNALDDLKSFEVTLNDGICDGAALMLTHWTGHAADNAQDYFAKLSDALVDHANSLDSASHLYNEAITAIGQFEEMLANLVGIFCDDLVAMVAASAAATCLAFVPGVDVLAAIYGAARAYQLFEDWGKIAKIFDSVMTGARGLIAVCTALDSLCNDIDIGKSLPSTGYYNPAQGKPPYDGAGPPPAHGQKVPA